MRRFGGEFGMGEKSEDAETVVDGYQNDAVIDESAVFVESARCGAAFVGAAVDPEHDGKRLGDGPFGNDDVEEEAVFFAGFGVAAVPVAEIGLRAGSAEGGCVANPGPGFCGRVRASGDRRRATARRGCRGNPLRRQDAAMPLISPDCGFDDQRVVILSPAA